MPKNDTYKGLTEDEKLKQAKEADKNDQKNYDRRHKFYNFSKSIVMGLKSIFSRKVKQEDEKRTFRVSVSDLPDGQLKTDSSMQVQRTVFNLVQIKLREEFGTNNPSGLSPDKEKDYIARYEALLYQVQEKKLKEKNLTLTMVASEDIHLGGTKPMSQYTDSNGNKWLAKQAVNCLGFAKLDGALLTEAGANIQSMVDPATAVQAFVGRTQQHGDVSFQRRLNNVVSSKKLDLFFFSKHPDIATDKTIKQVEALGDQILREHTTDWLLCNFDTKGENFILTQDSPNAPMVLHGIDKEASFNKLSDPQSQTMSRTYKPHNNNTLYNVVFTMYAEGKMNLNLESVEDRVCKIAEMSDQEYMANYEKYLNHIKAKEPEKYAEKYIAILERKDNLAKEYRRFFGELVRDRIRALGSKGKAAEAEVNALRSKLDAQGNLKMDKLSDVLKRSELSPAQEKLRRMKRQGFLELGLNGMEQAGMEKLLVASFAEQSLSNKKGPQARETEEKRINETDYLTILQKKFHNMKSFPEFVKSIQVSNLKKLSSPEKAAEALHSAFISPLKKASDGAMNMCGTCQKIANSPNASANLKQLFTMGVKAFTAASKVLQYEANGISKINELRAHPEMIYVIKLCKAIEKEQSANPPGKLGYWQQMLEAYGVKKMVNSLHSNPDNRNKVTNFSINDLKKTMLTPTNTNPSNVKEHTAKSSKPSFLLQNLS